LFGTTVFETLCNERLEMARQLLQQKSESIPLKQLAYNLGYAHTNNFVSAFKRQFGVTPGQYLKGRRR